MLRRQCPRMDIDNVTLYRRASACSWGSDYENSCLGHVEIVASN